LKTGMKRPVNPKDPDQTNHEPRGIAQRPATISLKNQDRGDAPEPRRPGGGGRVNWGGEAAGQGNEGPRGSQKKKPTERIQI